MCLWVGKSFSMFPILTKISKSIIINESNEGERPFSAFSESRWQFFAWCETVKTVFALNHPGAHRRKPYFMAVDRCVASALKEDVYLYGIRVV